MADKIEPISHLEKVIAKYGRGSGGSSGTGSYDDTQIRIDIADLDTNKQDKIDNVLKTIDKTVTGAINEINDSLLDNVTFSADYKNIIINYCRFIYKFT